MRNGPRVALLLRQMDEAFNARSWHGTNLRGSLRGLTDAAASWRPAAGRHNIWEVALHAAYWKYAVRRRLTGLTRGSFPLRGSNWFPSDGTPEVRSFGEAVKILENEHRLLRQAVAGLREADLGKRPASSSNSNLKLLTGIIAHDLYHAGQVQILKRLQKGQRGR
jgi:uncharacterized damage-inducible protein DinB